MLVCERKKSRRSDWRGRLSCFKVLLDLEVRGSCDVESKSKKEKQREDLQQSNPRYQTKKTKFFFPFGTDENTHDRVIPSYKLILVCLLLNK